MLKKEFWIPLIAAFATMLLLYVIGYFTKANFLLFKFSLEHTEISLFPIFIGLMIGFLSERILKKIA